jgi:hypothetical protein
MTLFWLAVAYLAGLATVPALLCLVGFLEWKWPSTYR